MRKLTLNISLVLLVIILLAGCSRKKDKFLNKGFHSTTTKYNYLFNGNNLLNQGKNEINVSVLDNFWDVLPTEKSSLKQDTKFEKKENENSNLFAQSEEKAVLVIQKHAMNIGGKEKNPQMDQAYFLLGESRYFDQRFIPALEAFNYILFKYPTSELVNKAKIWREKINIKLNYNELAVDNLNNIKNKGRLSKDDKTNLNVVLSQAYLNLKKTDSALHYLKIASENTTDLKYKARYFFILGQLYSNLDKKDSSSIFFDRIIKLHRKIPRDYYVYSFIEKSKNYENQNEAILELSELEKDIENKEYLSVIFHQIANLKLEINADSLAINYYNKSLRSPAKDYLVNVKNHNILADYYFDNKQYLSSAAHYDSTLLNIRNDKKLYRKITKKRSSLDDVIYFELSVKKNDSILRLVNMSEDERVLFFNSYLQKIKDKLKFEEDIIDNKNNISLASKNNSISSKDALFYFYNPTAVAYGKNEFKKLWGQIKRTDNWRNGQKKATSKFLNTKKSNILQKKQPRDLESYLKTIPSSLTVIDSISIQLDYAYFQLASIYSSKFLDYELSNNKIAKINFEIKNDKIILPAKYLNYKNCLVLGLIKKADCIKLDIIKNYPDSKYAEILNNPDSLASSELDNLTEIYSGLFKDFQNQKYTQLIVELDELIATYETDPLVPKMQLLKASAVARIQGFESYKTILEFISTNYSNSVEGKEAKILLDQVIPLLKNSKFEQMDEGENFKLIYSFPKENKKETELFKVQLNLAVKDLKNIELSSSTDIYDNSITFVVLHGLKSFDGAMGLNIILEKNKNIINDSSFVISSKNYQILQIHKNLSLYLKNNL